MGHGTGNRMATGYLSEKPEANISGCIGVGVRIGGDVPLNSLKKRPDLKVVDVYGNSGDDIDIKQAQKRSSLVSDRYK